mmetsp:Transcript_8376/g.17423  ORF Transcript_8376/g.17423 Transcript_8376/m.17423 type:complete len:256 (+) Transcript_8376:158-925(+)
MGHSVSPFPAITPAIFPGTGPKAVVAPVFPRPFVSPSIGKGVFPVALSLSIDKVSVVYSPIGPGENTLAVALVLRELAVIDSSVVPSINSGAVALVEFILSFVGVPVRKGSAPVSVPAPVPPVTLEHPSVFFVHHASQSVWHARVPQHHTGVGSFIAVGIQKLLVHNLHSVVSVRGAGDGLSQGSIIVDGRRERIFFVVVVVEIRVLLYVNRNKTIGRGTARVCCQWCLGIGHVWCMIVVCYNAGIPGFDLFFVH